MVSKEVRPSKEQRLMDEYSRGRNNGSIPADMSYFEWKNIRDADENSPRININIIRTILRD